MARSYARRELSKDDGEFILWHVLEHLQESADSWSVDGFEIEGAIALVRSLFAEVQS